MRIWVWAHRTFDMVLSVTFIWSFRSPSVALVELRGAVPLRRGCGILPRWSCLVRASYQLKPLQIAAHNLHKLRSLAFLLVLFHPVALGFYEGW
jgi:hypothetical protein